MHQLLAKHYITGLMLYTASQTSAAVRAQRQASTVTLLASSYLMVSLQDNSCPRGEACPYAHNVFEYWLHPTRYAQTWRPQQVTEDNARFWYRTTIILYKVPGLSCGIQHAPHCTY